MKLNFPSVWYTNYLHFTLFGYNHALPPHFVADPHGTNTKLQISLYLLSPSLFLLHFLFHSLFFFFFIYLHSIKNYFTGTRWCRCFLCPYAPIVDLCKSQIQRSGVDVIACRKKCIRSLNWEDTFSLYSRRHQKEHCLVEKEQQCLNPQLALNTQEVTERRFKVTLILEVVGTFQHIVKPLLFPIAIIQVIHSFIICHSRANYFDMNM